MGMRTPDIYSILPRCLRDPSIEYHALDSRACACAVFVLVFVLLQLLFGGRAVPGMGKAVEVAEQLNSQLSARARLLRSAGRGQFVLRWRALIAELNRQKNVDMEVLLVQKLVTLLQQQDDAAIALEAARVAYMASGGVVPPPNITLLRVARYTEAVQNSSAAKAETPFELLLQYRCWLAALQQIRTTAASETDVAKQSAVIAVGIQQSLDGKAATARRRITTLAQLDTRMEVLRAKLRVIENEHGDALDVDKYIEGLLRQLYDTAASIRSLTADVSARHKSSGVQSLDYQGQRRQLRSQRDAASRIVTTLTTLLPLSSQQQLRDLNLEQLHANIAKQDAFPQQIGTIVFSSVNAQRNKWLDELDWTRIIEEEIRFTLRDAASLVNNCDSILHALRQQLAALVAPVPDLVAGSSTTQLFTPAPTAVGTPQSEFPPFSTLRVNPVLITAESRARDISAGMFAAAIASHVARGITRLTLQRERAARARDGLTALHDLRVATPGTLLATDKMGRSDHLRNRESLLEGRISPARWAVRHTRLASPDVSRSAAAAVAAAAPSVVSAVSAASTTVDPATSVAAVAGERREMDVECSTAVNGSSTGIVFCFTCGSRETNGVCDDQECSTRVASSNLNGTGCMSDADEVDADNLSVDSDQTHGDAESLDDVESYGNTLDALIMNRYGADCEEEG